MRESESWPHTPTGEMYLMFFVLVLILCAVGAIIFGLVCLL